MRISLKGDVLNSNPRTSGNVKQTKRQPPQELFHMRYIILPVKLDAKSHKEKHAQNIHKTDKFVFCVYSNL
jgi:hypothetical protein